ncbi:MAG: hypothetical protein Q4E83_01015 [bacterium]|nr:hypothetical protein [bacterium]
MSERSEGIPDSEGIELTRTAGSKAKLPERGANPRGRICGHQLIFDFILLIPNKFRL